MQPTIGRIVHYKLNDLDVESINANPEGVRNSVEAEEVCAAVIVSVMSAYVNLQVFLDGDCQYWATSRSEGDAPGEWSWPPRV